MKSENAKNPRFALRVLDFILPKEDAYLLKDSFIDLYLGMLKNRGPAAAQIWIWMEIIKSLPGIITAGLYWRFWMLRNYILVAVRNLKRHRVHSFINITGLSLGMAFSLLIFLWIHDEIGFDRFHLQKHNIAQVFSVLQNDRGQSQTWMGSYYPLAKALKTECPEIIEAARITSTTGIPIRQGETTFTNDMIALADPEFFNIFSFPLLRGDRERVLSDLPSIVITRRMAQKYFGNLDPLGETLNLNGATDLRVTGVLENVPAQSSLRFDCIIPFLWNFDDHKEPEHWGGNPLETYVLLHENTDFDKVARKITAIVDKHHPRKTFTENFYLHPLIRKHLYSPQGNSLINSIFIYSVVAFLVLIIACINFMNLSTARAATRSREIGMRKVLGGIRGDLIRQFMGESLLIAFISLAGAILLIIPSLALFNRLLNKSFVPGDLLQAEVLMAFIGTALITGILAGTYPALYLSRMKPVSMLGKRTGIGIPGSSLRKILVVSQFSASMILIICLLVFSRQMRYMQHKDLGFDRDSLLTLRIFPEVGQHYDTLKTELMKKPSIAGVTRSLQHPMNIASTVGALDWEGKDPEESISMNWDYIGFDYFQTLGLEFLDGRGFSIEHPSDLDGAYVINEQALKLMGGGTVVGRRMSVFRKEGRIIGVVKDFHFRPLFQKIEPFVFLLDPNLGSNIFLRLPFGASASLLRDIEETCKTIIPGATVATDSFNDLLLTHIYATEQRMEKLIGYFAAVAVLISCLGLFGLAAFMAERKTKEIGMRKVLGASVSQMIFMLSRDFTKWVLITNVIAWPIAYFMSRKMLARFAYRIPIGVDVFLFSGFFVLLIAVVTVSFQAAAAARANPIDSLRYE